MMTSVMVMATSGENKTTKSKKKKSNFSLQHKYNLKKRGNENKENNQLRNSLEHKCKE